MPRRDWTLLFVLAAIWGSSYLFITIGLRELSPSVIVFTRVALGAAVLIPIAWRRGALAGAGAFWAMLGLVAVVQVAAPFMLIAAGQQEISSSLAGILVASVPIFTAILAIFFDHEDRSEGLRLVGVLVGIAGVALLFGVDLSSSSSLLLGGSAVVLASLGYAVGGLLVKRRLGPVQPLAVAALVLAISAVVTAPAALASAPDSLPSAGPLAAVAALGLLGTGVAFAIFYGLIARVGPARSFIVTYLAPGFAVVYGAILLDETISVATIAGLGLILGGSYLAAEGRIPGRRLPEPVHGPDHPAAGGLAPESDSTSL
jgi:drug/metabolite transporter (DMT)-like permease